MVHKLNENLDSDIEQKIGQIEQKMSSVGSDEHSSVAKVSSQHMEFQLGGFFPFWKLLKIVRLIKMCNSELEVVHFNFENIWPTEFVYIGGYRAVFESIKSELGLEVKLYGIDLDMSDTEDPNHSKKLGADLAWVKSFVLNQENPKHTD